MAKKIMIGNHKGGKFSSKFISRIFERFSNFNLPFFQTISKFISLIVPREK